jgi:energy-coupling factor transporter ATP-binding protein EcfA2
VSQYAVVTKPAYNERIFIVGANGSGKSYFAARLLAVLDRWIAIDLKGDFGEDIGLDHDAVVITSPKDMRLRLFPRSIKRIIYRPKPADYGTVDGIVGQMFDRARALKKRYGKGHDFRFYLYCDEGLLQSRGRRTHSKTSLPSGT